MHPQRIGVYQKKNRNWYRNITRHAHPNYDFCRYYDSFRVMNALRRRLGTSSRFLKHSRMPPSYPSVDLYHHWATVDFGSTPWVVSSSVGLPFGWPTEWYRKGLKLLASDACKRIIVTGKCATEWQQYKTQWEPDLTEAVMDKVEILPPAQELLLTDWNEKPVGTDGPLRLAFVGGNFFRKGGHELVRVVQKLAAEGADIQLTVVSSMALSSQTGDTQADLDEAHQIMEACPAITWQGRLPNDQVLDVFRQAHIGLLPSYIETYGYTVLEAQAAGCATITTDIKAFPDINPDEVGWRASIDGPDYDFRSEEGRALISERLERGLYRILSTILDRPSVVREKGEAALQRIKDEHDPDRHRMRLQAIYDQAIHD